MWGMLRTMALLRESKEARIARRERELREREERLASAEPWTPGIKWRPELTIEAQSYRPVSLFDVKPLPEVLPHRAAPEQLAVSPDGRWCYCEKVVPRGVRLETYRGSQRGDVMFNGPVIVPAVHDLRYGTWSEEPWMSLTPMEILSLRTGTRFARGRVVVAGLGLGHQLCEVSHRRQVTSLVLIERDASLVEWIFPRLTPHLGLPVEVIVGDVYRELPKVKADVSLVDVFRGYGNNSWDRDRLVRSCPKINRIWAWGSAAMN